MNIQTPARLPLEHEYGRTTSDRRRRLACRLTALITVVVAAATFAASPTSATRFVPGAFAYTSLRCDATNHRADFKVTVNSQNAARQTVGYRMYIKPIGAPGFWQPWATGIAEAGALSWSGNFWQRGEYQIYVEYAWLTTSGWLIPPGEWIAARQAGWFRNYWETDFNSCTV